jgi:predicted double-glycine peptidase
MQCLVRGAAVGAMCAVAVAAASGLWLDVPYIHQEKDGCGSASLAMVLRYWQQKGSLPGSESADPEKIQQQLYDPKQRGIAASRMQKYVRDFGMDAFAFRADWNDLRANLAKGRPLIAALKPRMAPAHYAVVAGVAPDDAAVLLNDPERGKMIRVERAEFESAWKNTGNWTLLAIPRRPE